MISILEYYFSMSPEELQNAINALKSNLKEAEAVQASRSNPPVESWRCLECTYTNEDSEVVVKHVQKAHAYPREDAEISTVPTWL